MFTSFSSFRIKSNKTVMDKVKNFKFFNSSQFNKTGVNRMISFGMHVCNPHKAGFEDCSPYIYAISFKNLFLDLNMSSLSFVVALKFVKYMSSRFKNFVFIFREGFQKQILKENYKRFQNWNSYIVGKYIPGTITNFKNVKLNLKFGGKIKNRVLRKISKIKMDTMLAKGKRINNFQKKVISNVKSYFSLIFFFGSNAQTSVVANECKNSSIPNVGFSDVKFGPSPFSYSIIGNFSSFLTVFNFQRMFYFNIIRSQYAISVRYVNEFRKYFFKLDKLFSVKILIPMFKKLNKVKETVVRKLKGSTIKKNNINKKINKVFDNNKNSNTIFINKKKYFIHFFSILRNYSNVKNNFRYSMHNKKFQMNSGTKKSLHSTTGFYSKVFKIFRSLLRYYFPSFKIKSNKRHSFVRNLAFVTNWRNQPKYKFMHNFLLPRMPRKFKRVQKKKAFNRNKYQSRVFRSRHSIIHTFKKHFLSNFRQERFTQRVFTYFGPRNLQTNYYRYGFFNRFRFRFPVPMSAVSNTKQLNRLYKVKLKSKIEKNNKQEWVTYYRHRLSKKNINKKYRPKGYIHGNVYILFKFNEKIDKINL